MIYFVMSSKHTIEPFNLIEMNVQAALKNLNVPESKMHTQPLKTSESPGGLIFSNPPHEDCPVKPILLETADIDHLKKLMSGENTTEKFVTSPAMLKALGDLQSGKITKDKMGHEGHALVNNALQAYVNGNPDVVPYKKVLQSFFKKVTLAVYAVQNVTVCANSPWIISGDGPVNVVANEVLVFQGGIIQITTAATISINNLQKFSFACS
jgi:hypothetical protein